MTTSLHNKYPSVAISPQSLWTVLFGDPKPPMIPCVCNQALTVLNAPEGGLWLRCPSCQRAGDIFEYFQTRSGISDPVSAIQVMRERGVKILAGAESPAVLRSYQKRVRSRNTFNDLHRLMESSQIGRVGTSPTHKSFNIEEFPHRHPLWWCSTSYEIDAILGDDYEGPQGFHQQLNDYRLDPDLMATPALVVPVYDPIERLIGVWARAHPNSHRVWRGAVGHRYGLGFASTANAVYEPIGDVGVLTSIEAGMAIHASFARNMMEPPPVVAYHYYPGEPVPMGRADEIAASLPKRKWVMQLGTDIVNPIHWAVAKRLSAGVVKSIAPSPQGLRDMEIKSWESCLADRLEYYPPNDDISSYLVAAEWCPATAERVFPHLSRNTIIRIKDSLKPVKHANQITIRRGLTIVDTVDGWLWDEKGMIVATAVPTNVYAYRNGNKTRHKGFIRYGDQFYPFDTGRFRTDTFAVVEATLLKNGVTPPLVHPIIANSMADIALYLSGSAS